MIFISSPYSHNDIKVVERRVEIVKNYVAYLAEHSIVGLSAILYYHDIVKERNLPNTYEYWQHICLSMLSSCPKMHVLHIGNWQSSTGLNDEVKFAEKARIKIEHISEYDLLELGVM